MEFKELQKEIKEYMKLLPNHKTSHADAEDRASNFLIIQGLLCEEVLELELEYNELHAYGKMKFNEAMQYSDAKNAEGRKAQAEAYPDYNDNVKIEKDIKAMIIYLKTNLSIFNDAHLFCRNIAKEK